MKPNVYWITGPWPGKLAILARPRGADWLDDEVIGWKDAGLDVVVSLLTPSEYSELGLNDEDQIVTRNGLTFVSFPIADYSVPTSRKVTRQLVEQTRGLAFRREQSRNSLLTRYRALISRCRMCSGNFR